MSDVVAFLCDESGASAAEYVLILASLSGGIVAAGAAFGGSIGEALGNAGDALEVLSFTSS
jgi:pilus assembly protein Flp/PilA